MSHMDIAPTPTLIAVWTRCDARFGADMMEGGETATRGSEETPSGAELERGS